MALIYLVDELPPRQCNDSIFERQEHIFEKAWIKLELHEGRRTDMKNMNWKKKAPSHNWPTTIIYKLLTNVHINSILFLAIGLRHVSILEKNNMKKHKLSSQDINVSFTAKDLKMLKMIRSGCWVSTWTFIPLTLFSPTIGVTAVLVTGCTISPNSSWILLTFGTL